MSKLREIRMFWRCLKINICKPHKESQYFLTIWKENCQDDVNFSVERHCKNPTQETLHWLNLLNLFKTCSVENNLTRKLNNITAMRQRISAIACYRILSVLHYPRRSEFSPIFQPDCFLRSVTVWSFHAANFHRRKVSDCNYIILWL